MQSLILSVLTFQPGAGPRGIPCLIPTYPALLSVTEGSLHTREMWFEINYMRCPQSRRTPDVPQLLVEHQVQVSAWSFRPLHTRCNVRTHAPVKSNPWLSKTGDGGLSKQLFWPSHPSNCTDLIINTQRIYTCPNSGTGKILVTPFLIESTLNDP